MTMMILCGYVPGQVKPQTIDSVNKWAGTFGVPVHFVDVSYSVNAYWEAITYLWDVGPDLIIVEQDNEIRLDVIPEFMICPEPWCAFGQVLMQGAEPFYYGLGCTRFRADFLSQLTFEEINAVPAGCNRCNWVPGCWSHIDGRIANAAYTHGLKVHEHNPPVRHHKEWCDCGVC